MTALAIRLRRFCAKLEREAGDYEPLRPATWPPLHFYRGGGRPRFLIYCTKAGLLQRWAMDNALPAGWLAFSRYGLPTPEYLEEIRDHQRSLRLPLVFVGDLDPLDLTVFAILRHGEANLAGRPAKLPVHYRGIDDRWLALCERHRRRGFTLRHVLIEMGVLEREHWSIARALLPDVKQLIGEKCFALLESGQKLELEGASNTGFYGDDFPALLLRHLRRPQGQVRR